MTTTATDDVTVDGTVPPTTTMMYRDAVRDALIQEMRRDPDVFMMGEDIGHYGGIYKLTAGLIDEFGADRMRDTPISEAGFVGAAIGAAMTGLRPVVELMFIDFALVAADQLLNQAAKMRFLSGDTYRVPLMIRTQQGVGSGTGPQHGQTVEHLFTMVPGFAVAVPSTPADAKGLTAAAIRMDDPTVVIENKSLYFIKGEVPLGEHVVPFGQAAVRREGADVTIVSYGYTMVASLAAAEELTEEYGISAEVIDLRTIIPLDWDTVLGSVSKTGRAVVAHEATRHGGFGGEIAAELAERAWADLKAPVRRVGGLNLPVPFAPTLEAAWQVQPGDIVTAALASVEQ